MNIYYFVIGLLLLNTILLVILLTSFRKAQEGYIDFTNTSFSNKLDNNVYVFDEPIGRSATGPLNVTNVLSWDDLRSIWCDAVAEIKPLWLENLIIALRNRFSEKYEMEIRISNILKQYCYHLEKKYPGLQFIFVISNPLGITRVSTSPLFTIGKVITGLGGAFILGNILCNTHSIDPVYPNARLTDSFTAGLALFNGKSGATYSHVLSVFCTSLN
jgi:hypothetical protein